MEAILGETLTREETLEEWKIPETPKEGEILERIQQEEIGQAIASSARNLTLPMGIDPRWRDSSPNGRFTMA